MSATAPPPATQEPWAAAYTGAPPEYLAWYDAQFRFDVLSVRQKLLTIAQKYYVEDDAGRPRFYVVRPPRVFLNILASLAATVISFGFLAGAFVLIVRQQEVLAGIAALFLGNVISGVVGAFLAPYRDVMVYLDESESQPLLLIQQENKLAFTQLYTLHDPFGVEVAHFRRNNIFSIMRRTWEITTPSGDLIATAQEDHLLYALLRRYLGTLYGLLRTNFEFVLPDGARAGIYNRKLTITDQYLLDLRADTMRVLDRRVALAMAILLDSAEAR